MRMLPGMKLFELVKDFSNLVNYERGLRIAQI